MRGASVSVNRRAGRVSDAIAVLGYIFAKPTSIGAVAAAVLAVYVFVCRTEGEWRRADPAGWALMHPGTPVPQALRCFIFCVTGALIVLIPLFILVYVKRRISSSGQGDHE